MRGRLPGEESKTNVTFALTDETNARLGLLTYDPVANRAKYGLKSKLVEALLQRFAAACANQSDTISVRDLRIEVTE